jgi:hypothetical protein
MYTEQPLSCSAAGAIGLERTRFFARQLITPDDLIQDQIYYRDKLRRHNRLLHGWGVVCGARIRKGQGDCDIVIEPGYILGPYGDEIFIDQEITVNLCQQGTDGNAISPCSDMTDPWCSNIRVDRRPDQPYYLAIRYAECQTRPVRVVGTSCGCNEMECEYSRIRDSYAIKLLSQLPSTYPDPMPQPDLDDVARCTPDHACPACPSEPWVILADITFSGEGRITAEGIDCFAHRRHVVSFANYYYLCRPELPRIRTIFPANAASLSTDSPDESLRRWVQNPRIEVTFDRQMATSQLSQPDSWLRIRQIELSGDIAVTGTRVGAVPLTFMGVNTPPGETGITAVYQLPQLGQRLLNSRYLVQIRATDRSITDTGNPPRLLDADFGGTALSQTLRDQIWNVTSQGQFSLEVWNSLSDTGATLPSGDGKAGGQFHSWFEVFDQEFD